MDQHFFDFFFLLNKIFLIKIIFFHFFLVENYLGPKIFLDKIFFPTYFSWLFGPNLSVTKIFLDQNVWNQNLFGFFFLISFWLELFWTKIFFLNKYSCSNSLHKIDSDQSKPLKPNLPNRAYYTKPCKSYRIIVHKLYWQIQTMLTLLPTGFLTNDLGPRSYFQLILTSFWTHGTIIDQFIVKGTHQWSCKIKFFEGTLKIAQVIAILLREKMSQNLEEKFRIFFSNLEWL